MTETDFKDPLFTRMKTRPAMPWEPAVGPMARELPTLRHRKGHGQG